MKTSTRFRYALLALVLILIVGWLAASWYTGQRAQTMLRQWIDQQNVSMNSAGLAHPPVLSLISDHHGLFSSQALVEIAYTRDDKPQTVNTEIDIDHGPWPMSRLREQKFAPVMAVIDAHLLPGPVVQEWFDHVVPAGQPPMTGHALVHYNGDAVGVVHLAPVDDQQSAQTLKFSGTDLHFTTQADQQAVSLGASIESLIFQGQDAEQNKVSLSLSQLQFQSDTHYEKQVPVPLGTVMWKLGQLTVSSPGTPDTTISNVLQALGIAKTLHGVDVNLHINTGPFGQPSTMVKSLTLAADFNDIDPQALVDARRRYREMSGDDATAAPGAVNTQAALRALTAALVPGSMVTVSQCALKTSHGQIQCGLQLEIGKNAHGLGAMLPFGLPPLAKGAATLSASKGFLADIMQTGGDDAAAQAQAQQLIDQLTQVGLVQAKDGNASLAMTYDGGHDVTFNGKRMPLLQFGLFIVSAAQALEASADQQQVPTSPTQQ